MNNNDIFQSVTNGNNQYILIAAVSALILVVVLFLNRHSIRNAWLNYKTRRQLKKLGFKQVANFRCPDGLGGHFVIDRLLMNPDSISVIMFIQYPGIIFCADNIDEWSQVVSGKSYKFKNPLVNLEHQVSAVSTCIPGVNVNGYLFFDHHAEFPKGKPDRVIQVHTIPESLKRDKKANVEDAIKEAWDKLRSLAR